MLKRTLAAALFAAPILAQANAVPGLDIRMWELTDINFEGRRGATFPNGEAGFMVGHSWCNGGTVNLPWLSQSGGLMVDQYPRIAFLLARESGGRMVQVTSQGHSKHSPTAYNFMNGPCAPCQAGGSSFFYVGCSDTYGSGINSSQFVLGPNYELNPWLGTWNPVGSYFDRGDPAVVGPAAVDGVRSLTSTQVAAFDVVKNKMIVREQELVAGAAYYAQVQAVVQGEPGSARANNIINKAVTISGGPSWSASASGVDTVGSVLTRWQGAHTSSNSNGTGDGSFLVAVKVTGPVAGMYHYEYAIHNIDNFRGGASFRIPVAPGATIANPGFRDLDTDPLNNWTYAASASEISFTAVGTNSHDWNTIYNCWFDCSIAPGAGTMTIDQARPGTGALAVQIASHVPSGLAFASKESVGTPCAQCPASFYQLFPANSWDLNGRTMTMTLNNGAYTVSGAPVAFVPAAGTNLNLTYSGLVNVTLPFAMPYPGGSTTQVQVSASGWVSPGAQNPLQIVPSVAQLLNGQPRWAAAWSAFAPNASGNVWYDQNASRAIITWNNVPMLTGAGTSTFQLQLEPSGTVHVVWQNVTSTVLSSMAGWTTGGGQVDPGPRDLSVALSTPFTLCAAAFDGLTLGTNALPVLGTTMQWQIGGVPAGTGFGALMRSLTQALPPVDLTAVGMPGCFAHVVAPEASVFLSPGTSLQIAEVLPNNTALVGVKLVGQAISFNPPLTPLGFVASNGMVLSLGL